MQQRHPPVSDLQPLEATPLLRITPSGAGSVPAAGSGLSLGPTRSSWPNSIFLWGVFCFFSISKDRRSYKGCDAAHQDRGFNSLAGKKMSPMSRGAYGDMEFHTPGGPWRTWWGRREMRHLLFTASRSLEQSIPWITSTIQGSVWFPWWGAREPAWKQVTSRAAKDSEVSQVPLVSAIIYILPCCTGALPSGSQLLLPACRNNVTSSPVSGCVPTFPLPAQGSLHSGSFHPFYRGNFLVLQPLAT